MADFICYCFEYTAADIRADVLAYGGHSEVLEKIVAAKKQKTCRCTEKHPERRCCLGDVRRVVDAAKTELNKAKEAESDNK